MSPPAAARRMLNLPLANTRTSLYPRRSELEGSSPLRALHRFITPSHP